jgi:hypothetical protein
MSPTDSVRCSECRALNEPRAIFCSRCGASLYGSPYQRRRHQRVTPASVAMGIALLLVLAGTVFTLYTIIHRGLATEETDDPWAGRPGTTATLPSETSNNPGIKGDNTTSTIAGVVVRPASITASSVLKATASNNYRPTNLLDGDLATAWNEGAEGPGIGEWVKLEFSRQITLTRIEIANGYQKDKDRFVGNPRVKSLEVQYSTGTTQLVNLLDTEEYQTITPTRQPVEWVKLTIVSVYPGKEWEDAALSEVRVYARPD